MIGMVICIEMYFVYYFVFVLHV